MRSVRGGRGRKSRFYRDSNIQRSHDYKEQKYTALVNDLSNDYTVFQFSVEVSVRGQITKSNRARLKSLAFRCCADSRKMAKLFVGKCSKAALLSSFSIFGARKEPTWLSPFPLVVR